MRWGQNRFFTTERSHEPNLDAFTMVVLDTDARGLAVAMAGDPNTGFKLPPPAELFDWSVFKGPEIHTFLRETYPHDFDLYERVKAKTAG